MARVPKKTYSRKNCELHENEKENVDPFDELLSSPLKQEVQFRPLSFWRNNVKKSEPRKNHSKSKYKLFESDDSLSPYQGKKKTRKKTFKGRSRKERAESVPSRSTNDCLKSDSLFKLEKYLKSPCLYKKTNATNTSRIKHDGYVTLRRPFRCMNVNMIVPPVESNVRGKEGRCDSSAGESVNDCKWKEEDEFNAMMENTYTVAKHEATVCEEFEKSLKSPEEVCKSLTGYYISSRVSELEEPGNDSLMNDSLELCSITGDFDLYGTEDNSKTLSDGEVWLLTSLMLEESALNDKTYVVDFERTELKDAEEESISQSDSLLSEDVSDLTNLVSDMTILNETVKEKNAGNSSSESAQDESELGLQSKALPVDDEKEDSNLYSSECRNVTIRRPCRNQNPGERVVSDVKSVDGDKNSETFTSTKIQETLKGNENEESSDFSKSSFVVPKTVKSPEFKNEISFDSSRLSMFAPPIFESTRFIDDANDKEAANANLNERERMTDRRETVLPDEEPSLVLKAGKKWQRSMSVLKQIQNGNFSIDVNKVKGRRFEKFMQETLEMQTDNSYLSTSVSDVTISNDTLMKKTVSKGSSEICNRESGLFESALVDVSINEDDEEDRTVLSYHEEKSTEVPDSKSLSVTFCNRTYTNRTVKVISSCEPSLEKPSLFMSALGLQKDGSLIEDSVGGRNSMEGESYMISPRDFILLQCGQDDVLPFEDYFNERTLINCKKIGEGVYGEVFMCNSDTVLKIIPIEGEDKVNGEPQKKFEEILSEVVIAKNLSNLRNGERNRTSGFSEMKRCWCVEGKYPQYLIDLWEEYDQSGSGSENDSPVMFESDQLYIVLELANGGKDLEAFVFNSSEQSLSVFIQTAMSLAVAEKAFEFEHRDLHWGNLLIAPTKDKFMDVVLDGIEYKIPTKGVKVSIIDFTLSRMSYEGCCIFNDLSVDPSLFTSQGDYQFEIYRMMQRELENDWSLFRPRNNLFWLHYTLDKIMKMVRYKNKNTQAHKKYMKKLRMLEPVIFDYDDSSDFVINHALV